MSYLFQRFGAVTYDGDQDVDDQQLYSAFDPARDQLLALLAAAVNFELNGSTSAVVANSPWGEASAGTSLDGQLPVADTYYEVPAQVAGRTDLRFPLLALWRESGEAVEHTTYYEGDQCRWQLHYVLGPLSVPDTRRLGAAVKAVRDVVQLVVRNRGHLAYENGAPQFGEDGCAFASLRVVSYAMGPANYGQDDADRGAVYQSLQVVLETLELDGLVEGTDADYAGASVSVGVGGTEGVLPDGVVLRTEVPVDPVWPAGEVRSGDEE